MANNLDVFNKLRKDIEEKVDEQLSTSLHVNSEVDVNAPLNANKLEVDIYNKYSNETEPQDVAFISEIDILLSNAAEFDDYDNFLQILNYSKNTSTHLQALDRLLSVYMIDTRRKSWINLSKDLQHFLNHPNDEVFMKCLKVHHKILANPQTTSDGYLNIIYALIQLFNTDFFNNSQTINENLKYHKRAINMFKLLLKSQNFLLKTWLRCKQKSMEAVLVTFVYMLNYSRGNQFKLGATDFLAYSDQEAQWFKKFSYGLQMRNLILDCLHKTPQLIQYFSNTFLSYLKDNDASVYNSRKLYNFSHSGSFLSRFLVYGQAKSLFPMKLKMFHDPIGYEQLVFNLVQKLNHFDDGYRKKIVVEFLQRLLVVDYNLFLNSEIQKELLSPFNLENINKAQLNMTVKRNLHLLRVLKEMSKSKYSKIVFNSLRFKSPNVIQSIINLTVASIRQFINKSELQKCVNGETFELLDCCKTIFSSYHQVFSFVNVTSLLASLKDAYKTALNHDIKNFDCKLQLAHYLCYFIVNYNNQSLKIIEHEADVLRDIITTVLTYTSQDSSNLILSIANSKAGFNIIADNHNLLIEEMLIKIWSAEGDEETFMNGISRNVESYCDKLLNFLYLISYNYNAIKALLSYKCEGTIVDDQDDPLTLAEIIVNCLNSEDTGSRGAVLGLKIIKILITNADVLLHLQHNYQLQQTLIELQANSCFSSAEDLEDELESSSNGTAFIIDECSSLRHNILMTIKYAGVVDSVLNEKLINQAKVVVSPYLSSSALRRYVRGICELQRFLNESKDGLHDHNWFIQARRAFKLSCKEKYKISIVADLLEQVPKKCKGYVHMWPSNCSNIKLQPEEQYGITLVIKFGLQIGILQSSMQNEENLALLLKQSKIFLNIKCNEFSGFDWFIGIVFLVCYGNLEKCKTLMLNFVNVAIAPILWTKLSTMSNNKEDIWDGFYYNLQFIFKETSDVNGALQMWGISPTYMVRKWLAHCFFTILDFGEICNFIVMAILYPAEYVIFYILAVFKHMKIDIFEVTHSTDFIQILKTSRLVDFHISNYFSFMDKLYKQYKNVLKADIK